MAFDVYGSSQSQGKKSDIDYDAINKYRVETAGLQERETLVGVVAGIVDLGTQDQPDAELKFDGSAEDEEEIIAAHPNTYFKDGFDPDTKKKVRYKCYPQKPIQCVAVAIDFPDIVLDIGQFYGTSNPQPLRMWLGGTFYLEGKGMVVARPTPLKVVNIAKDKSAKAVWSFSPLHLFYKMAVASKLIKPGEVFLPNNIDKLVGQAYQFEAQVYMKENKGKEYFTEYIKFSSGLGRGQTAPEIENTFLVMFNQDNDKDALKQLRNHVLNTIKSASNYPGSKIQAQLESDDSSDEEATEETPPVKEEPKKVITPAKKPVVKKPPVDEDFDDDIPF